MNAHVSLLDTAINITASVKGLLNGVNMLTLMVCSTISAFTCSAKVSCMGGKGGGQVKREGAWRGMQEET